LQEAVGDDAHPTDHPQTTQTRREERHGQCGVVSAPDGNKKELAMPKFMLLVGFTLPASAAEYYVVRGADKKCKVVETKPTDKTIVVVGDKAFVTREEADKQLAVVCKEK
jgi:hypothetical protein